jgi:hypothetical protein
MIFYLQKKLKYFQNKKKFSIKSQIFFAKAQKFALRFFICAKVSISWAPLSFFSALLKKKVIRFEC